MKMKPVNTFEQYIDRQLELTQELDRLNSIHPIENRVLGNYVVAFSFSDEVNYFIYDLYQNIPQGLDGFSLPKKVVLANTQTTEGFKPDKNILDNLADIVQKNVKQYLATKFQLGEIQIGSRKVLLDSRTPFDFYRNSKDLVLDAEEKGIRLITPWHSGIDLLRYNRNGLESDDLEDLREQVKDLDYDHKIIEPKSVDVGYIIMNPLEASYKAEHTFR